MPTDHIRYDLLAQQALRGVVQRVLADVAKSGLAGEHHFYISFDTGAPGVRISQRLREKYPQEMTIVLQHQFWDLIVTEEGFEVGLSFNGVPERLGVPFEAIKGFFDPSVEFALQFEIADKESAERSGQQAPAPSPAAGNETDSKARRPGRPKATKPPAPAAPAAVPAAAEPPTKAEEREGKPDRPTGGGEVVRLDRFRKK
jgi:hypothetical protein